MLISKIVPRALCALLFVPLSFVSLAAAAQPPPPVEHFFGEPDIQQVQLSPGGKHAAFLATLGTGKIGIALMELATGKVEPLVAAKDENIEFFFWKGDDHIVYAGDIGGNESPALRSISLSKRRVVALAESYRERVADNANWANVIDVLPLDPLRMIVTGPKKIASWNYGMWFLDIRTGERRTVPIDTSAQDAFGYLADNSGALRARYRFSGEKALVEIRRSVDESWTIAAEFPVNDIGWDLQVFNADNDTLYLTVNETGNLHSLSCRTLKLSEPIFSPPSGAIDRVLMSYDRSQLQGVIYTDDRARYHFFDAARARLQAQIDASLPGTFNAIVSRSSDEKIFIVAASSDVEAGTYYLLDFRQPRLMALGRQNSKLKPAQLRPMEPIRFTARDGLEIHGYLTRPAGFENRPAPLIINPHGGPFGIRDEWGYNAEVQFLASRGYAVLQVNYRGSGGYGKEFMLAGQREWGGKMQDDLTDAVQWAIAQGIADSKRVAIYGGSYGGYAALAGATFTPDLYRCAINYVGVSDLNIITSWGRGRFGRSSDLFYREWVGDDKDYKFRRSPVNFVERIKIPTLHAYGFNDPRVEIDHWKRLEPKLKQFNKPYEALIESDEGHGFDNEQARLRFYRKLEQFLAKHL